LLELYLRLALADELSYNSIIITKYQKKSRKTNMPFAIVTILILLFSIVLHELSHGTMAEYLGDPTAKMAGRLTLNPLKHLDPIGSVFLPLMLILTGSNVIVGWAKPVPINPLNLKDRKYGSAKVAMAGPAANVAVALFFGCLLRFLPLDNLSFGENLGLVFAYIVRINILLTLFNLTPIPPLDGSHILFSLLPKSFDDLKIFLLRYGFFILLFYIFFLFSYLMPLLDKVSNLVIGSSFF